MHALDPTDRTAHRLPLWEFVGMMASISAVGALGVDLMLPALPEIGRALKLSVENHQQLVISVYVGGMAIGQLFWGPLADRYGRRTVLLGAMAIYAAMSFFGARAGSIELLVGARALQGLAAASARVLATSIIRDCYSGRTMAKIMSLSLMIFMSVPVLAPSLGQLVLLLAPWQWIFYLLGIFSLLVALWVGRRLPETLDAAHRQAIDLGAIWRSYRMVLTNRALGYALASGCIYGGVMGFIVSSPQILDDVFGRPDLFGIFFGSVVCFVAVAALLNVWIVERFGERFISHIALLLLVILCAIRLLLAMGGEESLSIFIILNGFSFFIFGLSGSNMGSIAMEPMGSVAGTAASIQGFLSTMIGVLIGLAIGQCYQGTTLPLTVGWTFAAIAGLSLVLWVERGRLFRGPAANRPNI